MTVQKIHPPFKTPTDIGNFYCVDGEYLAETIFYFPVRTDQRELHLPVRAAGGFRVINEVQIPCVYVTHPSAFHEEDFNIEHVMLRVNGRFVSGIQAADVDAAVIYHTAAVLPDSRRCTESDERFLNPIYCMESARPRHPYRPTFDVKVAENVRLFSPEIEKFYFETMPTWTFGFANTWDSFRQMLLSKRFRPNFPFAIPEIFFQFDGIEIPNELLQHIAFETRKGILR